MVQSELTLINRIKEGHLEDLRATLQAIADAPDQADIARLTMVHFARWVIFDDDTRLLFASSYDGLLELYLDAFIEDLADGLDSIWSHCEGYPADGARDVLAFKSWVKEHQVKANLFFSAYPEATVPNVLKGLRVKQKFDSLLEEFQG